MPRSSRHKSHRARKHDPRDAKDRSESDEDGGSRDQKPRAEDSGTRVSKDPEPEKRKPSSSSQIHLDGGDCSAEHGKKRKDRADDAVVTDRWVGGREEDGVFEKGPKSEAFGAADSEKSPKSKLLLADSKGRSSRRREGSSERHEETEDKVEPTKHRLEKDSIRRESSGQYKDGKEKDRDRGLERDKNARSSRNERSDEKSSKKENVKTNVSEAERGGKKDKENTEWKLLDEMRNPELEKELEKRVRKRDDSEDKDKRHGDSRDSDDRRRRESDGRRLSSRDDHTKNGSYRDERHKDERNRDGRYSRDKPREDLDRDHKPRDDRHRDDSLSNRSSDRSHSKRTRDDDRTAEGHHKKSKLRDSDHNGGSHVEDHETKYKDTRGHKRPSDETEDHRDSKLQCTKQPRVNVEKHTSSSSKLDSHMDRARSEYRHPDKVDSNFRDNRPKSSTSSSAHAGKEQSRYIQSLSQGRSSRSNAAALVGDNTSVSGGRERDSTKHKDRINSGELLTEVAVAPQYDRTPRSDGQVSLIEKSPLSTSDRRYSNKSSMRRNLDVDTGQIKDGREFSSIDDKERQDIHSQRGLHIGSSSYSRPGYLSGTSPGHPHLPPIRPNSPSVLGSFEDDSRYQTGSSRYKRSNDYNGRSGTPWRSPSPWPPVANGFVPFQHGPPPPGFHSAIQQYPFPSLFGMRPSMDGVSYEPPDRFSGPVRPFGWRTPMVDPFLQPQMQGWDRSNGVFVDESNVYGKLEWDQNRQGWDRQLNMDFPVSHKEPEALPNEKTEMKPSNDAENTVVVHPPPNTIREKTTEPCETTNARICSHYLSKLDISVNLACPELYKQYIALLGTKAPPGEHDCPKNVEEDIKAAAKSSNSFLNRIFPNKSDAVFQRALLVYKNQKDAMKMKEEKNPSEAPHDKEKVKKGADHQAPENANANSAAIIEEGDASADALVFVKKGLPMEEGMEVFNTAMNIEKDDGAVADTEEAGEQPSDIDCADVSVEVVMPVCAVNSSRILNSPESTH